LVILINGGFPFRFQKQGENKWQEYGA
jgi:hypothetical protein